MPRCLICNQDKTEAEFDLEHILPNSIGGRLTVPNFLCKKCNNAKGGSWDTDIAKAFHYICNRLNIKRRRGKTQDYSFINAEDGHKYIRRPDGVHELADTLLNVTPNLDKYNIHIQTSSKPQAKQKANKIKSMYPDFQSTSLIHDSIDKAKIIPDTQIFHYRVNFQLCGLGITLSALKSCFSLAAIKNVDYTQFHNALLLLRGNKRLFIDCYYDGVDLLKSRRVNIPFHLVSICGDPTYNCIMGYIEYFGISRFAFELSNNFKGRYFAHNYSIDPTTGKQLDLDMDYSHLMKFRGLYLSNQYYYERNALDYIIDQYFPFRNGSSRKNNHFSINYPWYFFPIIYACEQRMIFLQRLAGTQPELED